MSDSNLQGNEESQHPAPEDGDEGEAQHDVTPAEGEDGDAGGESGQQSAELLRAANEALARSRSWKPASEWTGELPPKFIDDPAEFNRIYERNGPRLIRENHQLHAQIQELTNVSKKHYQLLRDDKDAEIRRLRADAERRQREAVEKADTNAFNDATNELKALDTVTVDPQQPPQPAYGQPQPAYPPQPGQPAQPAPQPYPQPAYNPDSDPNFIAWHQENAWYQTDANRTQFAQSIAAPRVQARGMTPAMGRAYYDAISQEVNTAFGTPQQRPPQRQNNAPAGGQRKANDSFEALPASYQKTFKETLVDKLGVYENTKEGRAEYAKAAHREIAQRKG